MPESVTLAMPADPFESQQIDTEQPGSGSEKPNDYETKVPVYLDMHEFAAARKTRFPSTVDADFMAMVSGVLAGSPDADADEIERRLSATGLGQKLSPSTTRAVAEYVQLLANTAKDGRISPDEKAEIGKETGNILDKVEQDGLLPTQTWRELGNLLYGFADCVQGKTAEKQNRLIVQNATTDGATAWLNENDTSVTLKDVGTIHFSDIVFAVGLIVNEVGDTFSEGVSKKMIANKERVMRQVKEIIKEIMRQVNMPGFLKIFVAIVSIVASIAAIVFTGGAASVAVPAVIGIILTVLDAAGLTDDIIKGIATVLKALGISEDVADKMAGATFCIAILAVAIWGGVASFRATGGTFVFTAEMAQKLSMAARTTEVVTTTAEASYTMTNAAVDNINLRSEARTFRLKSNIAEHQLRMEEAADMVQNLHTWFYPNMFRQVRQIAADRDQALTRVVGKMF